MATISEALTLALEHHRAGRLEQAREIYRRVLDVEPQHADAWHLLGLVAHQSGAAVEALEAIDRAVALDDTQAVYHLNRGEVLTALGRIDQAQQAYRAALERQPHYALAANNLGRLLTVAGRADEALPWLARAVELAPQVAGAQFNFGEALAAAGRRNAALAALRRAVQLQPDLFAGWMSLGAVLRSGGAWDEAVEAYRQALRLDPRSAWACNGLGVVLLESRRSAAARIALERAVQLQPDLAEAHNSLGLALHAQQEIPAAIAAFETAIRLQPQYAEAYNNLGVVLKDQARAAEALDCFRRAIALRGDYAAAQHNLLYTLHFAEADPAVILLAHRQWNAQCAAPLRRPAAPHANAADPERRLRVGYLSADFGLHPVSVFLLPLLEAHDRRQVEVVAYASVTLADEVTERCRAKVDVWRDVLALSDAELARRIRDDRVDILVDLSMHMNGTRIMALADKPAPVQITYLAYCSTTGLATMDYRIGDPYLDPPGTEGFYTEATCRLPQTYWCYRPLEETPSVNELPARVAGRVTFGSLNNFSKVTPATLETWAQLLAAVPRSRLLLHAQSGSHRQSVCEVLAAAGVGAERVEFVPLVPQAEYFRHYHRVDIGLDPFPYGGGTTTCDALWMGVPVVTLAGSTAVGRAGVSLLSNVGLRELIAGDRRQYVQIAALLAADLPRLAELRATLRQRMQGSPLMDAPAFARQVEALYRRVWQQWCFERGGTPGEVRLRSAKGAELPQ